MGTRGKTNAEKTRTKVNGIRRITADRGLMLKDNGDGNMWGNFVLDEGKLLHKGQGLG